MRQTLLFLLSILLAACGGNAVRATQPRTAQQPTQYGYTVRATYPHLTTSYTQGLLFADGQLWEGTGQYGESVLQRLDLRTGLPEVVARLPLTEFGEGIAHLNGQIYQLTWQSNKAYVRDATTGKVLREFRYQGEGWGLTTDGETLYMTDGSATIYTINPTTFRREKRTTVTLRGEAVNYLNELEWIDGRIWANVYTTDQIVIIDPTTGIVEGVVDLTGLLPKQQITATTDVLNGIAYDAVAKRIFVTGKNWSQLFEIEITKQ
ncbi:MAG: glutaminyl-peptide cyclotransferase [Alistipes sp.]